MSRSWIPLTGLTTPIHEIRQLSAHPVNQGGDGFPSTLHHPGFHQKLNQSAKGISSSSGSTFPLTDRYSKRHPLARVLLRTYFKNIFVRLVVSPAKGSKSMEAVRTAIPTMRDGVVYPSTQSRTTPAITTEHNLQCSKTRSPHYSGFRYELAGL